MSDTGNFQADIGRAFRLRDAKIKSLEAENARLRGVLELLTEDPPAEETPTIESVVDWMQSKARKALAAQDPENEAHP